jgi:hypothetical protein
MRLISSVMVGGLIVAWASAPPMHAAEDKLVYADFEKVENNRPVSAQGGMIQLFGYQESEAHKATFKGLEGATPPAPELVRIKKDDQNRAAKFDYSLLAPNGYTGVVLEIHGHADADGKPVADDVSAYKSLLMDVYATGIDAMRIELISHGFGMELQSGYPQLTFKVQPGMHSYKALIKAFEQPSWQDVHLDSKKLLKNLTSVNLTAFCDQCEINKMGMVVVDNVVFEK